ncbi:hypothetical protein BASA83_004993 [Batrachochytrium salamandrivorans]|nr:hypothetical protein BASA83_004993 [Batrachochytrium salamandrivorans]
MSGSLAFRGQRKRPLTIPNALETIHGVEWLTFTYTSRGMGTQYTVRIDIDSVDETDLTAEFRVTNSVYPRANVVQEEYAGNRWQYESTVNEIGWRLAFLNEELIAKRGLLQRAVDSFRNRFPDMKSRRVARSPPILVEALLTRSALPSSLQSTQEKSYSVPSDSNPHIVTNDHDEDSSVQDTIPPRKRIRKTTPAAQSLPSSLPPSSQPQFSKLHPPKLKTLMVDTIRDSAPWRLEVRIDHSVMTSTPSLHFRNHYRLFTNISSKVPAVTLLRVRRDRELLCNDIAWRLAFLNPESLGRSRTLLQRAVDIYLELYGDVAYRSRAALRVIQEASHI